jgi:hypothetical protein
MTRKEICAPVIELFGAHRNQILVRRRHRGPMYPLEVIVDPVDCCRSEVITQYWSP